MDVLSDKTELIIRRPTLEDIDFVIENIRNEDLVETRALGGKTVRECLETTPDIERNAWVWENNGVVICIFGVNPIVGGDHLGVIWLLATKFFDDNSITFAFKCKPIVKDVIKLFKYVFNYVYAENRKSIRWLKWLGFNVCKAEPIGKNGAKFHRFEMWNDECVIQ